MFPHNVIAAASGSNAVEAIGGSFSETTDAGTTAEVGYRVQPDGTAQRRIGTGGAWITIDTWLKFGAAGDFEVQFNTPSGDTTGSAVNTWLSCSSSRSWIVTADDIGETKLAGGTIELRPAGAGAFLDADSLTLQATQGLV